VWALQGVGQWGGGCQCKGCNDHEKGVNLEPGIEDSTGLQRWGEHVCTSMPHSVTTQGSSEQEWGLATQVHQGI
jgi:hypothetical protein